MFDTYLNGVWLNIKNNNILFLSILLGICIIIYFILVKYGKQSKIKNNFGNINGYAYNIYSNGPNHIPKIDEVIMRDMINLPNRNPSMLTSSMVVPQQPSQSVEEHKRTRMDILNMFYNSFDDTIKIK